jgi:hypothetical protein
MRVPPTAPHTTLAAIPVSRICSVVVVVAVLKFSTSVIRDEIELVFGRVSHLQLSTIQIRLVSHCPRHKGSLRTHPPLPQYAISIPGNGGGNNACWTGADTYPPGALDGSGRIRSRPVDHRHPGEDDNLQCSLFGIRVRPNCSSS